MNSLYTEYKRGNYLDVYHFGYFYDVKTYKVHKKYHFAVKVVLSVFRKNVWYGLHFQNLISFVIYCKIIIYLQHKLFFALLTLSQTESWYMRACFM